MSDKENLVGPGVYPSTENENPKMPATREEVFDSGIFGNATNFEVRYVPDYNKLEEYVHAFRALNLNIVLTSGTFDIIHIGHARYLEKAKENGSILIVGVDSDRKVKQRKGENRPIVPEDERLQMLAHLRCVDVITIKEPEHEKWELIKRVKPDTLIAVEDTYTADEIEGLSEYCGRIVVLERQAETSTTAKIRKLHIDLGSILVPKIIQVIEDTVKNGNV